MKLWKLSESMLQRYHEVLTLQQSFFSSFEWFKHSFQIMPVSRDTVKTLSFVIPKEDIQRLPKGLKSDQDGLVMIDMDCEAGKKIQEEWDKMNFSDYHPMTINQTLFGEACEGEYKITPINQVIYAITKNEKIIEYLKKTGCIELDLEQDIL